MITITEAYLGLLR